jgi:hypothetical protein
MSIPGQIAINMFMWFGILTLLTALTIAGVAAWFSIAGLMAIFSAAAMPIAVMAGTLEVGKLLTASWLYRYWDDTTLGLKIYLSTAVVVLMLITSMGIFGYLSKAHLDQSGGTGDAIAVVDRINGQIAREENRITVIQERVNAMGGGSFDVQDSINAQIQIRDTAWEQVQGDIDYNQTQMESVRSQLTKDLASLDARLGALDKAVNELRAKGVEVIETDAGGAFRRAETETVDYVAQAEVLRGTQQQDRDSIDEQKRSLRNTATTDIQTFQGAIDRYRGQAQETIQGANAEINKLRNQSTASQDDALDQIDAFNKQIDTIYTNIAAFKDEKFEAEQEVRALEKEVGPIKYVAQLLFGGDEAQLLDKAVQVFILMLVFVFDPLAVMLVIAANQTLLRYGINLEKAGPDDRNPTNNTSRVSTPREPQSTVDSKATDKTHTESSTGIGTATETSVHLQQGRKTDNHSSAKTSSKPRSVSAAKKKKKEKDIDLSVPPAIAALEKRIQEKLDG